MNKSSVMIALTNPVTPDRDEEFNKWYNEVHAKDLLSLPGMQNITRYGLKQQMIPSDGSFNYQYLAIYETRDIATTVKGLIEARSRFQLSDSLHPAPITSCYEPFFYKSNK